MAENGKYMRFINPGVLHLQKMGLELKCPLCLNLLNRPILFPCNHIFCSSCIPNSTEFRSKCSICKSPYVDQDLRPAPHMENIVSIYKSMESAFGANLFQCVSQPDLPDVGRPSNQDPVSANRDNDDKLKNGSVETSQRGNSINGQSSVPTFLANKRVGVSFHPTGTERFVKSSMPLPRDSEQIPHSSPHLWSKGGQHNEDGNRGIDLNQVTPTSPDSPPSFGDTKDSDDDSGALGGEHSVKRLLSKGTVEKESEDGTSRQMNSGSVPRAEQDYFRETKRQKLEYGIQDMAIQSGIHAQPACLDSENILMSNSEAGPKLRGFLVGAQQSDTSACLDANPAVVCAFCQSSRVSEASGPMLHYANGKAVVADELPQPNVLHVHTKCIEWAPQVYYVGETVMNLEAEVARGAKLKCSSCGLKGAALGCYAKSCRKSFHVPCAVKVHNSRWDCENFLMLCPTHSSLKFPNEKSKSGKNLRKNHSSETQIANQQIDKVWVASPGTTKEWVLCASALSDEEKKLLAKFARITGATISKIWKPNVTHVIAATDDMGACSRTLKVLMAILNGRWILKIDWIKACMEARHPVDEEFYEVSLDIHGCRDGPKNGRLRIMDKAPKLFSGLNFYFSGDFVPSYKGYLEDLILAAGGTILTKNMLISQGCVAEKVCSRNLVVYSLDPPVLVQRCEEAKALATQTGSWVIGHTWLLESIAACKLQPLPAKAGFC